MPSRLFFYPKHDEGNKTRTHTNDCRLHKFLFYPLAWRAEIHGAPPYGWRGFRQLLYVVYIHFDQINLICRCILLQHPILFMDGWKHTLEIIQLQWLMVHAKNTKKRGVPRLFYIHFENLHKIDVLNFLHLVNDDEFLLFHLKFFFSNFLHQKFIRNNTGTKAFNLFKIFSFLIHWDMKERKWKFNWLCWLNSSSLMRSKTIKDVLKTFSTWVLQWKTDENENLMNLKKAFGVQHVKEIFEMWELGKAIKSNYNCIRGCSQINKV